MAIRIINPYTGYDSEEEKKKRTTESPKSQPIGSTNRELDRLRTNARNFAEYTRMRKQQEVDEGMKSAADRLLQRYDLSRPGTLPVSGRMLGTPEPESRKPLYTSKAKMTDYLSPQARRFVQNNFPDMYAAGGLPTQSDVDKLIEAGGNPRLGKAFGKLEGNFDKSRTKAANINLEEADKRRQQEREAVQDRRSTYGIRQIGNSAAYVMPGSPLPDPEKQDLSGRAAEPWKYGIAPQEYASAMSSFDKYNEMNIMPEVDSEAQEFLNRFFDGKLPTNEEFNEKYNQLLNDTTVPDADVKFFFENGADIVGRIAPQRQINEEEYEEVVKDRDKAIELLGEDAEAYTTGNKRDYYERYGQQQGAEEMAAAGKADEYRNYGTNEGITLDEARKYSASPYAGPRAGYDLQRWSQTTQQERDAYALMLETYGEEAANEYLKSIEPELNQRLAGAVTEDAEAYAQEHPVLSSMKTIATAPIRGTGMAEQLWNDATGKEVDPYAPGMNLSREADTIRGTVGESLGGVGGFLYGTGMSIMDNIANQALWSGLGSVATLGSMGLSSAGSTYNDVIDRNGTQEQAMTAALVSGVAEGLFEKFSLDNFVELAKGGGAKNVVLNVLKQMGVEGSEETATSIANLIADNLIMGEMSNFNANVDAYMEQGMSEEEARRAAGIDVAKEIGLSAAGGALSGGIMGGFGEVLSADQRRNVKKEIEAAAAERAEAEQNPPTLSDAASEAAKQPIPSETTQPRDVREELEQEYMQTAEQQENAPQAAQEPQQQGETMQDEEVEGEQKNHKKTPEKGKNTEAFKQAQTATVETEEGSRAVRVVGVDSVDENGRVMLEVENENGQREVVDGANVMFDNAETEELLAYDAEKLDAKGLRMYLEDYDSSLADAEDYARAFSAVYNRARGGVDYEQAALGNDNARQYLTQDAMIDAFAAGQNVYNQMHNTVQPAAVEAGHQATAPAQAQLSAKEATKYAKVSRRYTQQAFANLGDAGRKNAIAQMELLGAIASRTKRTITIVDTIVGKDGQHANAMYNPRTGEIRVALDATEGAYAYAAMHELTHALKNEHKSEWSGFVGFVKGALSDGNQNWDSLVQYQMDQFGYTREQAEEEVVCNTVPALLQDERNVLKLYKGNRTLFDRVVDWVKGLLKDVKNAGTQLSKRSKSWSQMDALANDRKNLQEMYDRLMAVMENEGEDVADTDVVKMSVFDTFETEYDAWAKDKERNKTIVVGNTSDVLVGLGAKKQTVIMRSDDILHALRHEGMTDNIMKQIPAMMEKPIIVMKSSQLGNKNNHQASRVVMYGSVNDENGAPVIAVLELRERQTGGQILDMQLIKNAYGKDNRLDVQIEKSEILYLDPNKKRTNRWLHSLGLQLPSGTTNYGSIGSISYPNGYVKMDGVMYESMLDADEKFSMQDSEGNDLSEQQAEYFADSKVRDDEGNLMAVYHGTPSGNFEKFRSETYFTPMEWYADVYQNPSASSISYGKKNDAPMTYKAYLNITKPFDTRNAKERRIFMNEYYQKWGTGAPLSESGLPDWTDGMDLKEFIDEMGYDYDGLILDEGGIPDDKGGAKSRGLSYVIFDPAQAKLTDNKTPTDDERFRFSMKDPVEETRDLLAVHNLTEENMRNAMELGGLAMPSIAVIKAEQGHSMYGTISVIFDKSTIDPKASSANEIYGGDAWTPTFPHVEYEADSKAEERISNKYYELKSKYGNDAVRPLYRYATDLEEELNRNGGVSGIVDRLNDNTDMMQLYLADSGKQRVEPVQKTTVTRLTDAQIAMNEAMVEKLGKDVLESFKAPEGENSIAYRRKWMDEHSEVVKKAYGETLSEVLALDDDLVAEILNDPKQLDMKKALREAFVYMKNGAETSKVETDYEATKAAIREVVDSEAYTEWLKELFAGAEKSKGIRNGKELYTPSGNRRSFSATHWNVTLDNVVRAMRTGEKTGVGTLGRSIEGAAVKKYGSIKDVKADSDRLRTIPEAEYDQMRQNFIVRFSDLSSAYAGKGDTYDAGDALVEYITKNQTTDGIYQLMTKNAAFYKPSRQVAEKLAELVEEMKNAPTGYFEAKPRRAVGFEEMAAVIVPDNMSQEVREGLEKAGVNLIEYEAGNEEDRLAKMNSEEVDGLKFSLRDTDENVQRAMTAEEKAFELIKTHRITAAEADKLADEMLRNANSTYDRQKLAAEISRTFSYAETGEEVDMAQINDEMTAIAARVMEKSRTLDLEHEEAAKPVRDYLRTTRIRLTTEQRKEAANLVGSYREYSKALFGRVRLNSTAGTTLDSLWSELNSMAPQWFPEDATEGDMAGLLMQAVDATKPVYHTGMGMNMEESANWLAGKLAEQYFALPAVKAAAADAKTFGDSVRALKAAMTRFEEVSWSEFMHAQQELKAARTHEQRTQKQQEVAALRAKYRQWRERDTAQRKEREMRNRYTGRIEQTARTILNWMDKPTDAKHIPAGLHDTLARMLASLDFTGKDKKISRELADRLDKLADVMKEYQEGENESRDFFLERDQQLIDEIKRVAELIRGNSSYQGAVEGRGIYDLTGMELKELSKWLDAIRHNIMEASKLRGSNLEGYESVDQAAQMSMAEMSSKKPYKDKKGIVKAWNEHFGPDMQDSFSFFERLGTTAQDVFNGLRSGFDAMVRFTQQAEQHTKTLLEGVKLNELTGKKAKKYTFDLQKGGRVEMTKAQIMELYVLSRREQAQGHMYGGGIRVAGDEDVRPKLLTKADVKAITDTLSKKEKWIAEGLQKFLSRECAAWGNATSTKLVGYAKFGEENYWPIKTDSNERNTTNLDNNYAADINAIKNQGMTKQTKEGASNAIVVGDIFDTYTRHISNMAAYSAYAIPLSDFSRWYNSRGVKTEIEQLMGKKGLEYINNFLMAVNGTGLQDPASGLGKLAGKMSRNAKFAAVGANFRVVIQQPTSYARAAMYMSPKYLSQALTMKKPDAELVNKYCGIAQWKRWGFYETNIGPNLRQMLVGDQSAADKLREKATMLAAMGDDWTLNHLWNACELEVQAETEYKKGSEEYYQQVGKRMSEIIDRTQVVDSVFHRSQMMRSKNAWNQMLTNFMGEPTKTFNMLMSAISDYTADRKNKAARNRLARAITTYAVTGVLTAAAAAIVDAIRDEDADKEWAEKYLDALGSNAIDNLNPAGLLPGVKDILSLLQGYEPSRLDQQSIQRIVWAAQEVNKYVNGESKQNLYGVSYKVAQAVSSLLGIPASNLMRDLNAIAQSVTGVTPTLTAEARGGQTLSHLFNAMTDGDKKRADKLRADLREKAGMTPKEIDTAIAKKLAEDQRIKDAWAAKSEKRFADLNRIKNSLTVNGFSSETVDKAINTYGNSVTEKKAKEKNPDEELKVTLYTEAEVVSAVRMLCGVEKGGTITRDDVKAMISERIAGSSAKEPEKSVKSNIQTELKKDYLDAENKGNTAAMTRIGGIMKDLLGTKESAMQDWVKEQHGDNLRSAVDANNSRAALKAVEQMRRDGKTDSTIKSSLTKYKQIYIDAVNRGDRATASKIKSMLMGLGLTGKNGKALYTDETFEDWLK